MRKWRSTQDKLAEDSEYGTRFTGGEDVPHSTAEDGDSCWAVTLSQPFASMSTWYLRALCLCVGTIWIFWWDHFPVGFFSPYFGRTCWFETAALGMLRYVDSILTSNASSRSESQNRTKRRFHQMDLFSSVYTAALERVPLNPQNPQAYVATNHYAPWLISHPTLVECVQIRMKSAAVVLGDRLSTTMA